MSRPSHSFLSMIAGAALVIAGANSADPLVLVGVVLIVLGLVGAVRGRRGEA